MVLLFLAAFLFSAFRIVPAPSIEPQNPFPGLIDVKELAMLYKPILMRIPIDPNADQNWVTISNPLAWSCNVQDLRDNFELVFVTLDNCSNRVPYLHWIALAFLWCGQMCSGLCVHRVRVCAHVCAGT